MNLSNDELHMMRGYLVTALQSISNRMEADKWDKKKYEWEKETYTKTNNILIKISAELKMRYHQEMKARKEKNEQHIE